MPEVETTLDWFTYTAPPCVCGHFRYRHSFIRMSRYIHGSFHHSGHLACKDCGCIDYQEDTNA
jgi:hypothetical protein